MTRRFGLALGLSRGLKVTQHLRIVWELADKVRVGKQRKRQVTLELALDHVLDFALRTRLHLATRCNQESFQICDDILPQASRAVANTETEVADPVSLRFKVIKLLVVVSR